LIFHEALKMKSSENFIQHQSGPSRLTSFFMESIGQEQFFPIESPDAPLTAKKPPTGLRSNLSVHVNCSSIELNETTENPPSAQISDRIW